MEIAESFLQKVRIGWKSLPLPIGWRLIVGRLVGLIISQNERISRSRLSHRRKAKKGPLIVSGYLSRVAGLGKAARLTGQALQEAGFDCIRHDLESTLFATQPISDFSAAFPYPAGGVWILHCNPPEAEAVLQMMPYRYWRGRYIIAIWAWELEALPTAWLPIIRYFHEIWAPSSFVADAIRPHAKLVRVMPHPIITATASAGDRARFGIPPEAFVFAALADGRSTFARKNPLGAALAFMRAYPYPSPAVFLLLKLINPADDPKGMAELEAAIVGRSDIKIYTQELDQDGVACFLASIDALVSLHRSEGFGLVLTEVMSLGKPVIATGWSGNLEYMTGALSEGLVRFRLAPADDRSGRYEGLWADPDLSHAAELIRKLVDDSAFRNRLSTAGPDGVRGLNIPWQRNNLLKQVFPRFL